MAKDIQTFDLRLEDFSLENVTRLLLSKVRPDWPVGEIKENEMEGGIMNYIRMYSRGSDLEDAVVLRVYLNDYSDHSVDVLGMQVGHHVGVFPRVLAMFDNGVIYHYAIGRKLKAADFENPKTIRAMAREIAQLHSADLSSLLLLDRNGRQVSFPSTFKLYEQMRQRLDSVPDHLEDPNRDAIYKKMGMSADLLRGAISHLEQSLESLTLPKSISHFDFHHHNGVYNEDTDEVTLLDFEFSGVNYEAFDIGGLPSEAVFHSMMHNFFENDIPPNYTEEIKRTWAEEYLKRKFELVGRNPSDISEDDLEKLLIEHQLMKGAYALHWIMTMMLVICDPDWFHPETHINMFYQSYLDAKKEFPALKERYQAVKARLEARNGPHL